MGSEDILPATPYDAGRSPIARGARDRGCPALVTLNPHSP